jgi:hypothetical protein
MRALAWVYSEGLANKKKTSNQSFAPSTHRPFWFDLPERFYAKLQKVAIEFQMTRAALVTEALKMKPAEPSKGTRTAITPARLQETSREELIREFLSRARAIGWQQHPSEQKTKGTDEDFTRIFWLDLPDSFYQEVKNKAKRYALSEKQFVTTTVNQFIQKERRARRKVQPISDVQEELVKEFNRTAGQARWIGVSKQRRKEHARKIALKRWGKKE